ncbi:MAG: NTP transferase domain-containing protein, partial [Nitrospinaceae bacterium]|nr:NTP transferase domain-containing protein [Nitrospinaceae bacterium]NIR55169.1 NTP transferase domain-containing protein [Nitrospinaceae bacterium]NIS85593.1 NTP transferase domain-containing protein [Nitrospinaceae bacterium]NIT82439.1 NTP transferase domain-containing protein [Nitrospinaceae bacterium]NIU44652.1 NTP transferase domain-containing protein [Nitrospinaceae bacterium]
MEFNQYDAILAAGEGKQSYKVYQQHKAFLPIGGQCIISYVIKALLKAESVRSIYVIGPRTALLKHIEADGISINGSKAIHVLEQKRNLYENIWHTFLQTLPEPVPESALEQSPYRDRAVLVVPCDSPLITPHEIDYFVQNCDLDRYDLITGLTPESSLMPFYPGMGKPGVKMAYLHMKENRYRISNLHLAKPIRILNRHYIQRMYHYRYQRNLKNVILFGLNLIGKDKKNRYTYYIGLLLGLLFSWMNAKPLVRFFRSWVPKKGLEECISNIMNTRFVGLETPLPGATLDVDNARDYEVIKL